MTCNIHQTPWVEPLPLYTRHDPDALSIRSAAPSYVSETPTYTSRRPSHDVSTPTSLLPPRSANQQTRGLPPARYAPGFQSRAPGSVSEVNMRNLPVNAWSTTSPNNSRQYEAVARRRASQAASSRANANPAVASISQNGAGNARPSSRHGGSPNASSSSLNTYPLAAASSPAPPNPLEDPYLVGEEAARRARAQRIYREMCLREEEATRMETRSWEFMFLQMTDWEERVQCRRKNKTGRSRLLNRLGLRP
ncbi:uncharacterized protein EI97DRAFT_65261 [Westerdykella ornata]|uniref:Uncharacterized protein n=1 Tax=Westerdykella ornata TaxID=318751 RepID=A0A6A6JHN4_WESOR|nr:uncharacterized protein EI97DRAFT_65261 [Westerdykella ornata]KAF2275603.1 hypothetical protein EI97DRAFT_65261 [Westerdykella ornata]